jgi:hypothetical protein
MKRTGVNTAERGVLTPMMRHKEVDENRRIQDSHTRAEKGFLEAHRKSTHDCHPAFSGTQQPTQYAPGGWILV